MLREIRHLMIATPLFLILADVPLHGGVVTHVAQENDSNQFRTTNVAKANDPDGDNAYGTAGYVLYTIDSPANANGAVFTAADPLTHSDGTFQTISALPSFLSLANNGQGTVAGGFSYPVVDDPRATPGTSVTDIESGLALRNLIAVGTEASVLDIVIGAGFPTTGVRVGVLGFGLGEDIMSTFRLTQTAGTGAGSATATRTGTQQSIFSQFFDIIGAASGDRYTLFLTKAAGGVNPNVAYAGLTFDVPQTVTAVPEPATLTSAVIAGVMGLGASWRRRKQAASIAMPG